MTMQEKGSSRRPVPRLAPSRTSRAALANAVCAVELAFGVHGKLCNNSRRGPLVAFDVCLCPACEANARGQCVQRQAAFVDCGCAGCGQQRGRDESAAGLSLVRFKFLCKRGRIHVALLM
jgi:hypothetical protein